MNNLKTHNNEKCPNMLIEKDGNIYLYNSKKASVPGVNPIKFDNFEESFSPAPELGQHTEEILQEYLGLDSSELQTLKEEKII